MAQGGGSLTRSRHHAGGDIVRWQPDGKDGVKRSSSATKPARSREEIELVFDRNKGAIYALYSRALARSARFAGQAGSALTITPQAMWSECSVISSELHDPDMEAQNSWRA